jgi:adenylate cyclase
VQRSGFLQRCALQAGPLIVGEMGDIKCEIVMLGDTMNTQSGMKTDSRRSA